MTTEITDILFSVGNKNFDSAITRKNKVFAQFSSLFHQAKSLLQSRVLVTGLVCGLGISTTSFQAVQAQQVNSTDTTTSQPPVAVSLNRQVTQDGIYLYGQSAQPDQIQQEYFVFQVRNNRVIGAVYMPRSSFDCFYGTLKAGQMDLTVVDSYEHTTFAHSVDLKDYQPIARVSSNDQRILNTCQASEVIRSANR